MIFGVTDDPSDIYETVKIEITLGGTTFIHKHRFTPFALQAFDVVGKNLKKEMLIFAFEGILNKMEEEGRLK